MKIIFVLCNEPFRGAQDEVVSDGTLVIPQPMIRLNVLAAVPLIKKLFAKDESQAQAQSKIGLLPLTPMMLLGGPTQSYTPTLHLEVRLKKANDSGQGEIIFSDAFSTTENWRNFTQTIEIAKDKLADCEEGELILTWKNQGVDIPKVWIDELKVERSSLEVLTWADYYPYGLVMREGTCNSYRYQYQGETAEKDKETGWNHFELREYDPVTGRWLSTDPYGEFWSPYVGMGNDPVNNIDPDGGFTDPGYANSGRSAQPPKSTNVAPPKPPSFFSADYWKIGEGKTPEFVKDFVQLFPPTAMVVSGHTMAKGKNPITQENVSGFSRYVGILDFIPEGGTAAKIALTPFVFTVKKIAGRRFISFTAKNYNKAYWAIYEKTFGSIANKADFDVHHIFPQEIYDKYINALYPRFNNNNPVFMYHWQLNNHRQNAYAYNEAWDIWFNRNPTPTLQQILDQGKIIMSQFGFNNLHY